MTADGACGKVVITWKNVTPPSLTFQADASGAALDAGVSVSWTGVNEYLEVIQTSDDSTDSFKIAINFKGNDGQEITCGNFQPGDATLADLEPADAADPIPSLIEFDQSGAGRGNVGIDGIGVYTYDYGNANPDQLCIRNNNC